MFEGKVDIDVIKSVQKQQGDNEYVLISIEIAISLLNNSNIIDIHNMNV